jgi:hypothetical protein
LAVIVQVPAVKKSRKPLFTKQTPALCIGTVNCTGSPDDAVALGVSSAVAVTLLGSVAKVMVWETAAACVKVNVWPATVIVPVRDDGPGLLATCIIRDAENDAPPDNVIQFAEEEVAVHEHPVCVVTNP